MAATRVFALSVANLPRRKRNKIAAALKRLAQACLGWLMRGVPGAMGYRLAQIAIACGLAATVAGGIAGPAHAGGPIGGPTVNDYTSGNQQNSAVARDADGDYVVVWQSYGQDGDGWGVYARRYDAAGNPRGFEFRVNTDTSFSQHQPDVAMDADGNFVVVWEGYGLSGSYILYDAIWAQRYDRDGVPVGGQMRVSGLSSTSAYNPAVAMDNDGDFVVCWQEWASSYSEIFARGFNWAGAETMARFRANQNTAQPQYEPDIAMDATGDFVVVWTTYYGSSDANVVGRRFNAAGAPQGGDFTINPGSNPYANLQQDRPSVAMDVDGNFVVGWQSSAYFSWSNYFYYSPYSYFSVPYSARVSNVYVRRYDAAGVPQNTEDLVNNGSMDLGVSVYVEKATSPSVSMDADGDYVVAWVNSYYWSSYGSIYSSYSSLVVRAFDPAGGGLFGPYSVTVENSSSWSPRPAVAMDADGDFTVVWHDAYYSFSYTDIYGFNFDTPFSHDNTAAPMVAGVFVAQDHHHITQGERLAQDVTHLTVSFSERMDQSLAENTANWSLTRNGAPVAIVQVVFQFNQSANRYEARLDLGANPLSNGDYTLTVSANIEDDNGDALDGDQNGSGGDDFTLDFVIDRTQRTGAEIDVSNNTFRNVEPAVAVDADGDFVVVWTSYDSQGDGVFARLYNADGTPKGAAFQVNVTNTGDQYDPAVAMDADGNFVVVWEGGVLGSYFDSQGVGMRRFDATGTPLSGEIQVNNVNSSFQGNPDVAMSADGDFVVVWDGLDSAYSGFDSSGVFFRLFDRAGNTVGPVRAASNYSGSGPENRPAVAMDADGDFVIAWERYQPFSFSFPFYNPPADLIEVARFTADGYRLDQESVYPDDYGTRLFNPDVAMDADGDAVVVFEVEHSSGARGIGGGGVVITIGAMRFDAGLNQLDPEYTRVDASAANLAYRPAVAIDNDGDYVVVWEEYVYGVYNTRDVMARRYNWLGQPQTNPFSAPSATEDAQMSPDVAMDADGDFVVVWEHANVYWYSGGFSSFALRGGGGYYYIGWPGIRAQRFAENEGPAVVGGGITDVTADEDDAPDTIDLTAVFTDSGEGSLIFNVSANTNPTLVNAVADSSGMLTLTYLADQNGTSDITVRATDPGGAFVEDTFTVTVNAVNDAPVLDNTSSPAAVAVKGIAAIHYEIGDVVRSSITDVDAGALKGVAIVGASGDGQWQYSLDGGSNWTDFPVVSDTTALLLDDDNEVRFVPDADATGTALLQYRAWDQTDGNAPGDEADVSTNGGITAYSADQDTMTLTIVDANVIVQGGGDDDDGCAASTDGAAPWGLLALMSLMFGGWFTRRKRSDA